MRLESGTKAALVGLLTRLHSTADRKVSRASVEHPGVTATEIALE